MYTHLHARRSGRSTRLVRAAIAAIHQGHAVYILCTNKPYMRQLVEQVNRSDMCYLTKEPKYETLESIGRDNIDWKNTKIIGAHSNCKLFIDHQVYEELFNHLIDGYHAYDGQVSVNLDWATDQLRR